MAQATLSRIVSYIAIFLLNLNDSLGALQFLGNLFEYFLVRRNQGKKGEGKSNKVLQIQCSCRSHISHSYSVDRYHLTVVGATSGDVSISTRFFY